MEEIVILEWFKYINYAQSVQSGNPTYKNITNSEHSAG